MAVRLSYPKKLKGFSDTASTKVEPRGNNWLKANNGKIYHSHKEVSSYLVTAHTKDKGRSATKIFIANATINQLSVSSYLDNFLKYCLVFVYLYL